MAVRYYDDAIMEKIKKWIPENSNLRVFAPEDTKRLFEIMADDGNDQPFKLPFVSLSRNNDIELISNIKQPRSYDGLRLIQFSNNEKTKINKIDEVPSKTALFNIIPIRLQYQLDIYTKYADEGGEYLRNFLFKLINNPVITIEIPYNSANLQKVDPTTYIEHIANIRVLNTISDTSGIQQRLFNGQFTRWTIPFEVQDAFLFSIPYKRNWILNGVQLDVQLDAAGKEVETEYVTTFEN